MKKTSKIFIVTQIVLTSILTISFFEQFFFISGLISHLFSSFKSLWLFFSIPIFLLNIVALMYITYSNSILNKKLLIIFFLNFFIIIFLTFHSLSTWDCLTDGGIINMLTK